MIRVTATRMLAAMVPATAGLVAAFLVHVQGHRKWHGLSQQDFSLLDQRRPLSMASQLRADPSSQWG
jgi:hypothetical protein